MGVINMAGRKEQVLEQFKKIFDAVDKDKSGGLDRKEIMNFMKDVAKAMGESDQIPKDEAEINAGLDEMFKELDTDGDGVISFDEVLGCAEKNGAGEFFDGIDGASEEEWAMGLNDLRFGRCLCNGRLFPTANDGSNDGGHVNDHYYQ